MSRRFGLMQRQSLLAGDARLSRHRQRAHQTLPPGPAAQRPGGPAPPRTTQVDGGATHRPSPIHRRAVARSRAAGQLVQGRADLCAAIAEFLSPKRQMEHSGHERSRLQEHKH